MPELVPVANPNTTPSPPRYRYTPEQYLSFERGSPSKHEYFNGTIYGLTAFDQNHCGITTNLIVACCPRLEGRPFKFYFSQMRLKVEQTGLYTYPDAMIVHSKRAFVDDHQDTLTNPQVIIEVFSEETADYDRHVKFEHYKTISSLKEYLLIDQDARWTQHHTRRNDGSWTATEAAGSGVVSLPSVGCRLPLDEIHDEVNFPA